MHLLQIYVKHLQDSANYFSVTLTEVISWYILNLLSKVGPATNPDYSQGSITGGDVYHT